MAVWALQLTEYSASLNSVAMTDMNHSPPNDRLGTKAHDFKMSAVSGEAIKNKYMVFSVNVRRSNKLYSPIYNQYIQFY